MSVGLALRTLGPIVALAFLTTFASPGCTVAFTNSPAPDAGERAFIITFWCGPPLSKFTDAAAEQIAEAGFNVVGPPCEGPRTEKGNLKALDVADRHGLKMWIADSRFGERALEQPQWGSHLDQAVTAYRDHPALAAYFVGDEPSADQFKTLGKLLRRLRHADPSRFGYINLFPDYVGRHLEADTYREYVEQFIQTVQPRLLSYDYYPFGKEKNRSTFFANLTAIRALAREHDIPFMLIMLTMPHASYRDPTEAELSWQAFHALCFGARGISYFAYWTPTQSRHAKQMKFYNGLVENGKPTLHYFQAARLNRAIRAVAEQLGPFRSMGVADSLGEIAASFPVSPIEAIEGGPVTAGMFEDKNGRLAVLLVNRDYRYGINARLRLRDGTDLPELFDPIAGAWARTSEAVFSIPPGAGRLLRWEQHRR